MTTTKENIINYASRLTTIGSELQDIFMSKGISNVSKLLSIKNLHNKEYLSGKQIDKICLLLNDNNDELKHFIINFQNNYLIEKDKCQKAYLQSKKNFTKLKNVLPLLYGEFNDGEDRLDDILDFFGVDSEQEIFDESEKTAALFRKQNNMKVDSINLKAWLRRGELDFYNMDLPQYDESGLKKWIANKDWQKSIDKPEYFKTLPKELQKYGVAIVLVPYLPNTVYGAVRWIDGKPLIEINGDDLRKEVFNNKRKGIDMTADGLSGKYKVNPMFVSYWLRKAQYQPWFQKNVAIDFLPI